MFLSAVNSLKNIIKSAININKKQYPDRFKKVALLLGKNVEEDVTPSVTSEFNGTPSKPVKIADTPEMAELKKMQRINDFFDSLSESGSEYHSSSYSENGDFGGDGGDGACD